MAQLPTSATIGGVDPPGTDDAPTPAVAPPLTVELQHASAVTADGGSVTVEVVRVLGEVDLTTADQLVAALAELIVGPATRIVVDTVGMTFCGLRGLAATSVPPRTSGTP